MNKFLFLNIFFITGIAFTEPAHDRQLSSVNLGVRYSSVLQKRGVIFYNDFQLDPVVAILLLQDRVEFLGDSVGYRDFIWGQQLRFRTQLVSINDDPLFPAHESVKNGFPNRTNTFEWSNGLELFLPAYNDSYRAELNLTFSNDLNVHNGSYVEILAKLKITDFRLFNTKIEPQFVTSLGWGDTNHNKYFYGPSANETVVNNFSYGLWISLPEKADRYYPIVQLTKYSVLTDKLRNAEYAKDNNEGILFSFIASVRVLE